MTFSFHPEARTEFYEAVAYYEESEQNRDGRAFTRRLDPLHRDGVGLGDPQDSRNLEKQSKFFVNVVVIVNVVGSFVVRLAIDHDHDYEKTGRLSRRFEAEPR